jgi:hypothetical protein
LKELAAAQAAAENEMSFEQRAGVAKNLERFGICHRATKAEEALCSQLVCLTNLESGFPNPACYEPCMTPSKCVSRFRVGCGIMALVATLSISPAADFDSAHKENVETLRHFVRIDTSNPPGNETKGAEFLKAILDREGIPSEIFELEPGRGNLVARTEEQREEEAAVAHGPHRCRRRRARESGRSIRSPR